jgi:uncharacterized protein (UPF0179 family)
MTFITLIGEQLAKKGTEFVYMGMCKTCRSCKLKMVCSNLKKGRRYKITNVRDKHHECALHEGGVRAVEIEELPIVVNIPKDNATGSIVLFEPISCKNRGCSDYQVCHPLIKNKKYKIVKVLETVKCPEGYHLKKVKLEE